MHINTDLVTKQYQDKIINELNSDIDKYLNKNSNDDEIEQQIREDSVQWSLTGNVSGESEKYIRFIENDMNDKNSSTLREKVTIDLLDD